MDCGSDRRKNAEADDDNDQTSCRDVCAGRAEQVSSGEPSVRVCGHRFLEHFDRLLVALQVAERDTEVVVEGPVAGLEPNGLSEAHLGIRVVLSTRIDSAP